ncbi:endolytic transglycosylase MltG [filamentous cyanobacterium CCP1]|nr:endolytic transglycosylase MltG [filamentous cyanobacterium CCP2]PSB67844.1 endolytic transglycosylase MltG [filamentous cyanobacterium CCP1]
MTALSRISKWFFYLILLPATIGVCGWQGWAWWSWASAPVAETEQTATETGSGAVPIGNNAVQLQVPPGSTAQEIGENLKAIGLIRSTTAWNLWTRWQTLRDRSGSFQAGTYEISPTEPLEVIASKIWTGSITERSFTIPEGWSIREMAAYFEDQGFFSAEEFVAATQQIPTEQYPWLSPDLPHLEGFLYPDTYKVAEDTSPTAIVYQMLDRFEEVALPIYENGQARTNYTFLEWVTLASIVEKETVVDEERPEIAGVFARRLQEGIPLGADPTVEYALGIRQTEDQPLTYAQVSVPSPYNTYINAGLPPTPIASPGISSLDVSIEPPDTEYLYFVARYDGTHVFSRTLAEHEAAQAAIQDGRSAQSESLLDTTN